MKGTVLHEFFEKFAQKFPDHLSETNTVFYLIEWVNCSPIHLRLWLWCSHFEHTASEDLRNLVPFIEEALRALSTSDDSAFVEMVDGTRERVVLSLHNPKESIVELLKNRGVCVKPNVGT